MRPLQKFQLIFFLVAVLILGSCDEVAHTPPVQPTPTSTMAPIPTATELPPELLTPQASSNSSINCFGILQGVRMNVPLCNEASKQSINFSPHECMVIQASISVNIMHTGDPLLMNQNGDLCNDSDQVAIVIVWVTAIPPN